MHQQISRVDGFGTYPLELNMRLAPPNPADWRIEPTPVERTYGCFGVSIVAA